jgi:hypothetical protein
VAIEFDLELIEELSFDFDVAKLRTYSGRGMYGKVCMGLVGGAGDLVNFVLEVAQTRDFDFAQELDNVSTDSMAFDTIFYWPRITLTQEAADYLDEFSKQNGDY